MTPTRRRRAFLASIALTVAVAAVGAGAPLARADDDQQPPVKRDPLGLAQGRLDTARDEANQLAKVIDDAETQQAQLTTAIADAEREIPQLRDHADELRLAIKERAVDLYMGHGEKIDEVLDTDNVVDGARVAQLSGAIAKHDQDLAAELRATAQALETRETELRDQRGQLQDTIDKLQPLNDELLKRLAVASSAYEKVKAAVDQRARSGAPPDSPSGATVCPVQGFVVFTDDFGEPRPGGPHPGIDMPAVPDTPVAAVVDGDMTHDTGGNGGNGAWLVGTDGVAYYYAHFSHYEGDNRTVKAGDIIGYVGSTGNATGPHLHFEMHPGGPLAPPVDAYTLLLSLCEEETAKPPE